jgi:hypothetical protein
LHLHDKLVEFHQMEHLKLGVWAELIQLSPVQPGSARLGWLNVTQLGSAYGLG